MIRSLTDKLARWRRWKALDNAPRSRRASSDAEPDDAGRLDHALRTQAAARLAESQGTLRWKVMGQITQGPETSHAPEGEPFRLPWAGIGLAAAATVALAAGIWFAVPGAPAPQAQAPQTGAGATEDGPTSRLAENTEPRSERELLFDDLRSAFRFVQTGLPIPRLDRFVGSSSQRDASG